MNRFIRLVSFFLLVMFAVFTLLALLDFTGTAVSTNKHINIGDLYKRELENTDNFQMETSMSQPILLPLA